MFRGVERATDVPWSGEGYKIQKAGEDEQRPNSLRVSAASTDLDLVVAVAAQGSTPAPRDMNVSRR